MLWLALVATVSHADEVRTFGFTDVDHLQLKVNQDTSFETTQLADCPPNPFPGNSADYWLAASVLSASARANGDSSTDLLQACQELHRLEAYRIGDWPDLCPASGVFTCSSDGRLLDTMSHYMDDNGMTGRTWLEVGLTSSTADPALIWYPVILAMHTYGTPSLLDWQEECGADGVWEGTAAVLSLTVRGTEDFWLWLDNPSQSGITEADIPKVLSLTYRQADGSVRAWPGKAPKVTQGTASKQSPCAFRFTEVTGLIDPADAAEASALGHVLRRPHLDGLSGRPLLERP